MKSKLIRLTSRLAAALAVSFAIVPRALAEDAKQFPLRTAASLMKPEAQHSLVIGFRAKPETRIAFRKYLKANYSQQLEKWKHDGTIQEYLLVFSNLTAYNGNPDAIVVLTFPSYRATYNWNKVEEEMPGGLTPDALKLGEPMYSMLTEWATHRYVKPGSVIEIGEYRIPDKSIYPKFVHEFLEPLWNNWIDQGPITEYTVHVALDAFGQGAEPWQALVVLGYTDEDAYSNRSQMVLKSYADLQNNVQYNYWTSSANRLKAKVQFNIAFYNVLASSWK